MILERIEQDFKTAMKEKREITLSSLRNLKAELANAAIAKREPLKDDEVLAIIAKKVKQHKDSIASFSAGNRQDLVDHEKQQMAVLQKYLPEQLSEQQIREAVKGVLSDLGGAAVFGKVMGMVMAKVKGQADGDLVSKIVKEQLAGK